MNELTHIGQIKMPLGVYLSSPLKKGYKMSFMAHAINTLTTLAIALFLHFMTTQHHIACKTEVKDNSEIVEIANHFKTKKTRELTEAFRGPTW